MSRKGSGFSVQSFFHQVLNLTLSLVSPGHLLVHIGSLVIGTSTLVIMMKSCQQMRCMERCVPLATWQMIPQDTDQGMVFRFPYNYALKV